MNSKDFYDFNINNNIVYLIMNDDNVVAAYKNPYDLIKYFYNLQEKYCYIEIVDGHDPVGRTESWNRIMTKLNINVDENREFCYDFYQEARKQITDSIIEYRQRGVYNID